MTKLAVIGSPIEHSLSPALHKAAYIAQGLPWTYERYEVGEHNFNTFLEDLDHDFRGLSVTMPLKSGANNAAHTVDFHSKVTGSTNTLLFEYDNGSRQISGFNTDVFGIVHALKDVGVQSVKHSVVIGSGATAASAVVACAELGAEHVTVFARNVEKANFLSVVAQQSGLSLTVSNISELSRTDVCELAISTLPGSVELSLEDLPRTSHATLLDVAYNPWPSSKATLWSERGGEVVSGLRMLARQALIQVRIFVHGSPEANLENEDHIYRKMCEAIALDPLI